MEEDAGEIYGDERCARNEGESSNTAQGGDNASSGPARFTFMASSRCFNTHAMKI